MAKLAPPNVAIPDEESGYFHFCRVYITKSAFQNNKCNIAKYIELPLIIWRIKFYDTRLIHLGINE
jgi:hypothetical protein